MAHTVRIHPPKAGDEEWLASMIAPLLDEDADSLASALARGAVTVGGDLEAPDAAELVEVLRGFGAKAELLGGRASGPAPMVARQPTAPISSAQTQPFDGRQLRRMLQAQEPVRRGHTGEVGLLPETRSARPIPPPLQGGDTDPPQRSSQATPDLAPPRRSRMDGPPARAGETVTTTRTGSTLVVDEPPAEDAPRPRTSKPIPPQPSLSAKAPGTPVRYVNGAPATEPPLAPQLADQANRTERNDLPPWFPQMSIRPATEEPPRESGRSWLWIVLIMALAGAAAWWLRTR